MNRHAPEMVAPGPEACAATPVAPSPLRAPQWPNWRIVALLSACVFAIYLPGLVRTFDFHDSFYYFAYVDHLNCAAHPQAAYLIFSGRPLLVLLNCGVAGMIDTVSDARIVRLCGLVMLSASGAVIVGVLRAHGVQVLVAVGAVAALLAVPGWQLVLSMSQAAPIVWSLPPVVGAFILVNRIADTGGGIGRRELLSFAGAVVLLFVASMIYQQNTSILFALCAISMVLSPLSRGRYLLLCAVAAYGVNGLLYLLAHRMVVLPVLLPAWGFDISMFSTADERSVAIATDVIEKIRFFLQVTPRALALWFLDSPTIVPLTVALLSVALAIANFERDRRASAGTSRARGVWPAVQRLGLVAMLVPLSVAPILLAQGSLIVYRHLIAYQWLIVLYLVAASTRLAVTPAARRAVTGALLMAALVAGIYAHWNFDRNSARINAKELQFIEGVLSQARARLPAHIVVIQPDVVNLGSFPRLPAPADEFGVTTTMYPQDIPWIVFGAAAELGLPREHLLSVTGARADAHGLVRIDALGKVLPNNPLKSSDVIIDMRQFVAQVHRGEF